MKRKVSVATVLSSEAKIIFLDEPTTGLDPISRKELWATLKETGKERFTFLTTHYLEEAEELADQIGVLDKGKLIRIGTLEQLRQSVKHNYSMKLLSKPPPDFLGHFKRRSSNWKGWLSSNSHARRRSLQNRKRALQGRWKVHHQPDITRRHILLPNQPGRRDQLEPGTERRAQKRNKFSQILAGVLVNSIYEMKNYPIVLINTVLPLSLFWF